MIVTVTLNPALDKTTTLDEVRPGALNRLGAIRTDAGGKGINVSATIAALGGTSTATGFLGGPVGADIGRRIAALAGVEADFVPVHGATRTNLKVMDEGGRLTELNEPGVEVEPAEVAALEAKILAYAERGALVVLAGSLCQGVAADFYARLTRLVHDAGGRVYVDADGEAFRAALTERPDFVKPNRHELTEYFGVAEDSSLADLAELGGRLIAGGVGRVAISLGSQGALFVTADQVLTAPPLDVPVRSSVGAGDAMAGALALGIERHLPEEECYALAMAASAGACTTSGTAPADKSLVETLLTQVVLENIGL
jgi:1-phosphofructokinase